MSWFGELRWTDFGDILVVAGLLFAGLLWLRRTRARTALLGLLLAAPLYLAAVWYDLQVTLHILQGFLAVAALVLVVVFQDDLKRFFEQVATWGLRRGDRPLPLRSDDVLIRAVARLAETRTGALVVLPGRDPLARHLDGGIAVGGKLSEPLLLSLFDASSPGHDGAIVVSRDQIERFAVHLPLSSDRGKLGAGGTRHAAALGLAERCDALVIVVSEERGTISIARGGELRVLEGPEQLASELRAFTSSIAPSPSGAEGRWRWVRKSWREGVLSISMSVVLWLLLVPGERIVDEVRRVRVGVENLPVGYELLGIDPQEVDVTVSGRRRQLAFGQGERISISLDAWYVSLGRRTFQLEATAVKHAPGLHVRAIDPSKIRLSVREPSAPVD